MYNSKYHYVANKFNIAEISFEDDISIEINNVEKKCVLVKTHFSIGNRYFVFVEDEAVSEVRSIYGHFDELAEKIVGPDECGLDIHIYFVTDIDSAIEHWLADGFGKPIFINDILSVMRENVVLFAENEYEFWLNGKNNQFSCVKYRDIPIISILDQAMVALPGIHDIGEDVTNVRLCPAEGYEPTGELNIFSNIEAFHESLEKGLEAILSQYYDAPWGAIMFEYLLRQLEMSQERDTQYKILSLLVSSKNFLNEQEKIKLWKLIHSYPQLIFCNISILDVCQDCTTINAKEIIELIKTIAKYNCTTLIADKEIIITKLVRYSSIKNSPNIEDLFNISIISYDIIKALLECNYIENYVDKVIQLITTKHRTLGIYRYTDKEHPSVFVTRLLSIISSMIEDEKIQPLNAQLAASLVDYLIYNRSENSIKILMLIIAASRNKEVINYIRKNIPRPVYYEYQTPEEEEWEKIIYEEDCKTCFEKAREISSNSITTLTL